MGPERDGVGGGGVFYSGVKFTSETQVVGRSKCIRGDSDVINWLIGVDSMAVRVTVGR